MTHPLVVSTISGFMLLDLWFDLYKLLRQRPFLFYKNNDNNEHILKYCTRMHNMISIMCLSKYCLESIG